MGDLSRRLEACEGRLQTRVAELAGKVEGVERSHPPVPQACACSGKLEAVAAKVGTIHHTRFMIRLVTGVIFSGTFFCFLDNRFLLSSSTRHNFYPQ